MAVYTNYRIRLIKAENIPEELKVRPQWVNYRLYERSGSRLDKVPYTPGSERKASSTDLMTWGTFEEALDCLDCFDGVGFVFCSADPYVGVDLDGCVDPETGSIEPWALRIIQELASYTELSPSGKGVHIFARGKIPRNGKQGRIEMYDHARFFTVTGHVLGASGD